MGIRGKFTVAAVALYIGIAFFTFFAVRHAVYKIIEDLGTNIVKKQSLLIKNKTLSLIRRELALSFQLVDSPVLKQWALNEEDSSLKALALQELESYRKSFKDNSFFFIVDRSKNYYFNNAMDEFKDRELRYRLSQTNINDQWYFRTMKHVEDFELNVDYDNHLKVTKVWINTIVKGNDGSKIGLGGTGFELTDFINELVHSPEEGLSTILIDREGGLQGHSNPEYIRHNSNLRGSMKKITVYELMPGAEKPRLTNVLARLSGGSSEAEALFLNVEGHRYLAGVSQIEDIGWFVISLADLSKVIRLSNFMPIFVVTIISLLSILVILSLVVNRLILRPLSALTASSEQIASGRYEASIPTGATGEIGKLARSFNRMIEVIKDHMENLEEKVDKRTSDLVEMNKLLDHHARTDPLTGLSNRREIIQKMEIELNRTARFKRTFSILLLDLDRFKEVNDLYGHAAGDFVLKVVSQKIGQLLRSIDTIGRWGGEEFLVILPETTLQGALVVGEHLRSAIQQLSLNFEGRSIHTTLSIGAYSFCPGDTVDECIQRADRALYKAKEAGRNRVEHLSSLVT